MQYTELQLALLSELLLYQIHRHLLTSQIIGFESDVVHGKCFENLLVFSNTDLSRR